MSLFFFGLSRHRRQKPQGFAQKQKQHQTLFLEPRLTPSGLVDVEGETPDVADLDLPGFGDEPDDLDLDFEASDVEADEVEAGFDEAVESTDDLGDELEGDDTTLVTLLEEDFLPEEELEEIDPEVYLADLDGPIRFEFESGVFTVGETGEVSVDFLFDGGAYQGELAIFSLEGMEEFDLGSEAFIQEAARRALSDSELGHVTISVRNEGARFSGLLPGEPQDWNSGDYLGVKTFQMRPEDEFGVMLVPNGRVLEVLNKPSIGGSKMPLFSMATANPDDMFAVGQIADVFGDGNAFVFEDMRLDKGSDGDYNDLIFQVRGAKGYAALMDEVVDPAKDWRSSNLGQAIQEYVKPYITPEPEFWEPITPLDPVIEGGDFVPEPLFDPIDVQVDAETLAPQIPTLEVPTEHQPLVGVIDTGFSGDNPDIDYSQVTSGYDWVDGDENSFLAPGEGNEHGTHVLGIIAAQQDNGIGIEGVNDDAPIWAGRAVGSGQWAESLVEYVDHFVESSQPNGVVNLSLDLTQVNPDGSVTTRYELTPTERSAIEYARQNGVLLVVAAGNDGGVMSALGQASQEFDNIITVGSAERLNEEIALAKAMGRSGYSSYGYGLDIVAPGGTAANPELSTVGDELGTMAGTSVATAKVTGAISRVWAANPDLSYVQVIDMIKSTATDLQGNDWDAQTGSGLLNLAAAITMARATTPELLTDIPATLIPEAWSGKGVVTPGERAAATQHNGQYYEWDRYTVRSGDSLSAIAQRTTGNGSDWLFIYNQNRSTIGSNPNLIYPGQVLWVPRRVSPPVVNPTPTPNPTPPPTQNPVAGIPGQSRQYIVRRGDTLWEIARRELGNGNRWREIMKTPTGGTFTDAEARSLRVGQSVYLPVSYQSGPGTPVTSSPITTYAEYLRRLYGGSQGVITQYPNGNHNAIDSVQQGAYPHKVYSLTNGEIKYIGTDQYGGKFINVWNSELQRTFTYVHFNGFNSSLRVGQTINAGTYLGNEGSTGNSTGRHTHVHVRRSDGSREDPLTALSRLSGSTPSTTPVTGNINYVNFSGTVGPKIGVNLRYSPRHSDRSNRNEPYGKRLEFDAWTTGETVTDIWLGTPDSRWFKVKGTNLWVPSAYIWGNPPVSGGEDNSNDANNGSPDNPTNFPPFEYDFPFSTDERRFSRILQLDVPYLVEGTHKMDGLATLNYLDSSPIDLRQDEVIAITQDLNDLLELEIELSSRGINQVAVSFAGDTLTVNVSELGIYGSRFTGIFNVELEQRVVKVPLADKDKLAVDVNIDHNLSGRYHRILSGSAREKVLAFVRVVYASGENLQEATNVLLEEYPDVRGWVRGLGITAGVAAVALALILFAATVTGPTGEEIPLAGATAWVSNFARILTLAAFA